VISPGTLLARLIAPVAEELDEMRGVISAHLLEENPAVGEMTEHISSFRGKQLRGMLVLLVGRALGTLTPEHPKVAAIVEMIHLATLVHDDVLDGATIRRRVACVNEEWDNQVAVLLGDFLYARSFGLSTTLSSRYCSQRLADATRRVCVGEIEQSRRRYDFEMPQADYERIAGAKTAELYSAACELGAAYPEEHTAEGEAMRAFGWELGLAFQIIDDCLDVVGEEEVVGKSIGNDVEDGKVTLAVLHTYAEADERGRGLIRDVYTAPGLEHRAARLRETVDLTPGLTFARERAEELIRTAMMRLRSFPETPARANLESLGEFVLGRTW
jgi:octaprenyl-diphosphate synthase